ncbi:Outer membrane protease, partial [Candidatus Electrothrix marina]
MKQSARKKAIRKMRGLGLAAGLISTGMLVMQAQAAAFADPYLASRMDLSFGLEEMTGDMTSSIGGEINHANGQNESKFFPISELEWPMDILLARFDASLTLNPMWRINGTLKTAVDDPDETMIDSDWLLPDDGIIDIYSESSISQFEAFILDVDLQWTYLRQGPWSLSAGVGYLHQDFEYEGNLNGQYSPTGMPGYFYPGDGSTGVTYENTFSMVYFLLGADIQLTSQFDLSGKFSVAPLASSEDELHHLYYNKVSTGDMDGTAYMFEVSGNFRISPWWFVEAGVQYTGISVDGDQYQVLGGAPL